MENLISNILFRFVTLRAPEKLEADNTESVRASTPSDSFIFTAVSSVAISSETERISALKNAAREYESKPTYIRDKESLISLISENMYSFAMWLKRERNNASKEEIIEKVRGISPVDNKAVTVLWDNLFYHIITKSDTSLRENIQRIIIAINLQKKIGNKEFKDKTKELAKADIIAPDFFSKIEAKEAPDKKAPVNDLFKREASLIYANTHLQHLESLEKELELVQKSYDKANTIAKKEYDEVFERETKEAYDRATLVEKTYLDPETGREVRYYEYEDLELPEYNFKPIDELNISSYYKGNLSQSLKNLQKDSFKEQYITTLEELKSLFKEDKHKTNDIVFKHANLKITNHVGEGGVVYKNLSNNVISSSGTFNIHSTGAYDAKSLYIMLFGIPQELSVISSQYKVTFPDNTSVQKTLFNQSMMSGGILKIDIFNTPGNYFNPGNEHLSFAFEATFNCSNNQQLTLTGNASINRTQLIIDNSGSGQPNPGLTVHPDYSFIHNDGWDTLNFPNMAPFKVITDIGFSSQGGSYTNNFNISGNGTYKLISLDINNPGEGGNGVNEDEYIEKYGLKRLGIADYRRVEQKVCCYVPGEVSHIENIMAREYKERTTKRLRRTEDTLTSTKEREAENLTDTTTTERFEMNQEISQMTSQQNSLGVQGGIRWDSKGAGPSGFVNTDMSYSSSKDTSNTQAINFAKDVTERALERVVNKIKEERITKIIDEFSEENIHSFDNKKGDNHISGVYRWVDKIYENRIINYGKRLMYEFAIPEPAAFHRFATDKNASMKNNLEEPKDPRVGDGIVRIEKPSDITETNYQHWAAIYNAEVEPCPAQKITTGKSLRLISSNGRDHKYFSVNDSIEIPEGYSCSKAYSNAEMMFHLGSPEYPRVITTIGNVSKTIKCLPENSNTWSGQFNDKGGNVKASAAVEHSFSSNPFYNSIPIGAMAYDSEPEAHATFTIVCDRTPQLFNQWKIDTFKAIIKAYEEKLREYHQKEEQLKALQKEKAKVNPLFYREIENIMLKKGCMEYFLKDNQIGIDGLIIEDTHSVRVDYTKSGLGSYADRVKFLEQAFEWDIMSYKFYPFYWAEKSKWVEYYTTECDDPTFKSFLQSGMARVIVAVRPGFEAAVNWFLETGEVWNGEEAPTIDDPLFKDIVDDLKVIDGAVEETWQSRVPTSLTVIQAGSIGLDLQGLPCDQDCGDYGFDSDGNSLNPIKQTDTKIGDSDQLKEENQSEV